MKNFLSIADVPSVLALVEEALHLKLDPMAHARLGHGKTLGLMFMNPSLRTRLSSQKAAHNLGMQVMVMNFDGDGWGLETRDGVVMNGKAGEHVKEAAAVIGEYCDILGLRSFATLTDRESDDRDDVLHRFAHHAGRPMINLESPTLHPLQSLADAVTISELKRRQRPKVVLSWAPHCKALPQAVANSFSQWMLATDVDLVITHPPGYELDARFTEGATVTYDQKEALRGADFVYVKNWSSYADYGRILSTDPQWMMTGDKMAMTNDAYFMHCLPVRRNLVVADEVLDSSCSAVVRQAGNRVFAAQAVIKRILEHH